LIGWLVDCVSSRYHDTNLKIAQRWKYQSKLFAAEEASTQPAVCHLY